MKWRIDECVFLLLSQEDTYSIEKYLSLRCRDQYAWFCVICGSEWSIIFRVLCITLVFEAARQNFEACHVSGIQRV